MGVLYSLLLLMRSQSDACAYVRISGKQQDAASTGCRGFPCIEASWRWVPIPACGFASCMLSCQTLLMHGCFDMCCLLFAGSGPCNRPLSAHQIPWVQGAVKGHRAHVRLRATALFPSLPLACTGICRSWAFLNAWQYMKCWHNLFGLKNLKGFVFYLCCTCMVPST